MTQMKAKMNRSAFVKVGLLAGCCSGSPHRVLSAEASMQDRYDSLESLKKGILWVSKWWSFDFRRKAFVVCLQDNPSYGQSRQSVLAWRKEADDAFALVWTFRTAGIGPIEVEVEEGKGMISVKAKAYTDLKDSVIAFVYLGATAG